MQGAIPVFLADGYIYPLGDALDWSAFTVEIPQADVMAVPDVLRSFTEEDIARMQAGVQDAVENHLASWGHIMERGHVWPLWKRLYGAPPGSGPAPSSQLW